MIQSHHAGEQKSHWDKTNKGNYHLKLYMSFIVTFALQHGGFVPVAWLAAKGSYLSFYRTQNTEEDVYSQVVLILCMYVNLLGTGPLGCRSASEFPIRVTGVDLLQSKAGFDNGHLIAPSFINYEFIVGQWN